MQSNKSLIFHLFLLLAGLVWIGLSADPNGSTTAGKIPAPQAGFLAPDFTLNSLDGKRYTLSELRGQAIILNLWASWCPPCRAEMPTLQKLYEEYRNQGLLVLAVNSTVQDKPAAIPGFVQQYGLTFPILLDEDGEVSRAYQLRSLPSSYFIGRDGIIREVVIGGPMSEALLRTRIEIILNTP
ncbi:MAG: TlpA disulfide reductase family protein [Anaerolineae bacterium]